MRMKTPLRVAATAASFALLVTACGGGDSGENNSGGESTADPDSPSGGTYSVNLTEPSYLAPASNCYETACGKVLNIVNDPVVSVDMETGELQYDGLLESVEPNEDNSVWTLKIKEGRTFHNGEDVTADSFINAWNYSANPANEQATAGFMSHIEGAGEGETMSGLKKIDDLTFEVTLNGPFSQFGQQLNYSNAFHPIAQECLDDIQACNEAPIGTGPYQIDGQWNHDQGITVTKWADYNGDRQAQADTIEMKMFADSVAAFRAWQGGTLDVLDTVEPTVYAEAVSAAGDRLTETETSSLTYMGFPTKTAPFDSVEYRQGVSMAINRQEIIDGVLNGLYVPATDIPTPVIPGHRDDACEYCEQNVEQAKQLFQQGGGQQGDTLELWFNAGSGHEAWVEAIGNQLKNNLGVDFTMKGTEWAQYLEVLDAGNFTGPFRLGWAMDYPSPENYVRPIVGTNGDSNYSGYSNKQLDELLVQGDRAGSQEEAIDYYQQAADIALEELPILPLWSGVNTTIWSENVDNVVYSVADSAPYLNEITVN